MKWTPNIICKYMFEIACVAQFIYWLYDPDKQQELGHYVIIYWPPVCHCCLSYKSLFYVTHASCVKLNYSGCAYLMIKCVWPWCNLSYEYVTEILLIMYWIDTKNEHSLKLSHNTTCCVITWCHVWDILGNWHGLIIFIVDKRFFWLIATRMIIINHKWIRRLNLS